MDIKYHRILVIEETERIQDLIRTRCPQNAYQIIWASNEAEMMLHLHEDAELGVVLIAEKICNSDFRIIKEIKRINPYVRIIILAENWKFEAVRKAMNSGVFDYLPSQIESDQLQKVIDEAIQQSFSRINAATTRQKLLALHRDLEIAGDVQNFILPRVNAEFNGCKLNARMIPTRNIGGDFYDYFIIDDYHLGLVIGDVSGKGIPAALFMAMTRSLIKMTALSGVSPDTCLSHVNNALSKENPSLMFATVFYAILNMKSQELAYCNAGHDLPYLVKSEGKLICLPGTGDMALGFDENAVYHQRQIELQPGELVFMYTDGVTEASDTTDKMYGKQRLENIIAGPETIDPQQLVDKVLAQLDNFSAGASQSDDITMLALSLKSQPAESRTRKTRQFSFTLQNKIEQLSVLQQQTDLFCKKNNLNFSIQHALEIALEEVFTNIVNYAYPEKGVHQIHISFNKIKTKISIEIRDDGQPFDPTSVRHKKEDKTLEQSKIGGWGLQIVTNFMDALSLPAQKQL